MAENLYVSDGFFHPPWQARRLVRDLLAAQPGSSLTQVGHLNAILDLDMTRFRALILYYHHKRASLEALRVFERFVQDGGGVLAIHSATASFKEQPRYSEILGGRFAGHGLVEPFEIRPAASGEKIFSSGSFTVKDELYLHELQPDINVHYAAQHEGAAQPVVWTRTEGDGRICYAGPGHRTATMRQPQVQAIIRRGLQWVMA